jgi:hypothetical protein
MDSMRESRPAGASEASAGGVKRAVSARVVGARWVPISAGGWRRLGCRVAALTRREAGGVVGVEGVRRVRRRSR